jgi:enterochelin esterase-like enzyme
MATPPPVRTPVPGAGLPWSLPAVRARRPPATSAGPGAASRAALRRALVRQAPIGVTHQHLPAALLRLAARGGPLESPWVAAGFGAALLASVGVVVWWRCRVSARQRLQGAARASRRPRWLRRGGLALWLASLAALTGLAGLNAYVGYVPSLPALLGSLPGASPGAGGSRVVRIVIDAPWLRMRPTSALVYLPPGYDTRSARSRRYPVVYLLHGYPGAPIDWFRAARVQQLMDVMIADGLARPMILVAPSASGGWLHDSEMLNQVGGPQVETFLTSALVQAVDARFRTVADRAGRAIGGMSSGGYGALNLGLRHQDTYAVILSLMPYGTPGDVGKRLLGGSRALWLANSPDAYIPTMRFRHRMWVDLLAGPSDPELGEAMRLAGMLRARRQPAVFSEVAGAGHTWRGVRLELPYALAFASAHLTGGGPRGSARMPLAGGQRVRPSPGLPAADARRRAALA